LAANTERALHPSVKPPSSNPGRPECDFLVCFDFDRFGGCEIAPHAGCAIFEFSSTHAPADDCRFDWAAGIHTVPSTATPSAQKWNDIGADVIFAKKFKRLVRRRNTLVSEGVDSLLPCRHAVLIIPDVMNSL